MNHTSHSPTAKTESSTLPSQDEIALRAHQLWCQQGCPHGQDVDNWVEAERQLLSEYAAPGVQTIPSIEDVPTAGKNSPYAAFSDAAPLATKVEKQIVSPGRPASRQSPTSLEL